jgi:dephospho-CoA kinase
MRIAIYGRTGSGKSTVSRYLAEQHGFAHCYPGARCRELALELFGVESKHVLNRLSDSLRAIDHEVWIRAALRGAPSSAPLVFDGMRYESDYKYFRAHSFLLWKVEAPSEQRYHRLGERRQEFHPDDDRHSGEWTLADFPFDVVLDNSGAKQALFSQIETALAVETNLP